MTTVFVSAQELNCNLVVNAQQTGNENVQVFKTLEKQLNEFINNTRWTDKSFALQERIDCSMIINIQNMDITLSLIKSFYKTKIISLLESEQNSKKKILMLKI